MRENVKEVIGKETNLDVAESWTFETHQRSKKNASS
jgi:hypothetical protein